MNKDTSHSSKFWKVTGIVLLSVALLLVGLRLFLLTDAAGSMLKNQVVKLAEQSVNGTLSIQSLRGDIWDELIAADIRIERDGEEVITLDTLELNYDLPSLLTGTFEINRLRVAGLYGRINEEPDGSLNVNNLIKTESTENDPGTIGVRLNHIEVDRSRIDARSASMLPDSSLSVQNLRLRADAYVEDEFSINLNDLSFELSEGRLPEPLVVEASGSAETEQISLNRLLVQTGRSLLRAEGHYGLKESTLRAGLQADPLSLKDLQYISGEEFPEENYTLSLGISGTIDRIEFDVQANGEGLTSASLNGLLEMNDRPVLRDIGLQLGQTDFSLLSAGKLSLRTDTLSFTASGQISDSLSLISAGWRLEASGMEYQTYRIDELLAAGAIEAGNADGIYRVRKSSEVLTGSLHATEIFTDAPVWEVPLYVQNLNTRNWSEGAPDSELSLFARLSGKGLEPASDYWKFTVHTDSFPSFTQSRTFRHTSADLMPGDLSAFKAPVIADTLRIDKQKFSGFRLKGQVNKDSLHASGRINLDESGVNLNLTLGSYLSESPYWKYIMTTSEFNAAELTGLTDFPTSLNLSTSGSGRSFDPAELSGNLSLTVDSSIVNGAVLRSLQTNVGIDKGILVIEKGDLNSQIVEGNFTGRRNISDKTDPDNLLNVDFRLKNLQPLAPLAGAEILRASGSVSGAIAENDTSRLQFDGELNLEQVNYDSLFIAEAIDGKALVGISDTLSYNLNIRISRPAFNGVALRDMDFVSEGTATTDAAEGNFYIELSSEDAGLISQEGSYTYTPAASKAALTWQRFRYETPVRTLTLQQPFNVRIDSGSVSTDTLKLAAPGDSFLGLAVPRADSVAQQFWIRGENFDFGTTQEIIFGKRYLDGVLKGTIEANRQGNNLQAQGAFVIDNLTYMESSVDDLELIFTISDERLQAETSVSIDGTDKITGDLNVPFRLGNPDEFEDSFFDEEVSGSFRIEPTELSRFQNILAAYNITGTSGRLRFEGSMEGTVNDPAVQMNLSLGNPTLSGIPVDSAFADLNYNHSEKSFITRAEIQARGQKAAQVEAEFPVAINFRTFDVEMPDESDSVSVDLITENFNLSVFNDFLNKEYMSGLQGSLNADIRLRGTAGQLNPEGFLRLDGAKVDIPAAGITLDGIVSDLRFKDSDLELVKFRAGSGKGDFTADGTIMLKGLYPEELDLRARASQFKLANTQYYNLTIDLDGSLTGPPTQPEAGGDLTIRNGFVLLKDFGDNSVEEVNLGNEDEIDFSPYDSLAMNMRVLIENNFFVRNRQYLDLEVEMEGDLNAIKESGKDLQLFGTLSGTGGYARPLGKTFELEEADFAFSGPPDDPRINIRTSFEPGNQKRGAPITIYYIVDGTAQDPKYSFESEPPMEQQDIICYTLFGKPCYSLESWQKVISEGTGGTGAKDLLVDVLLDEVEALATRELGIDVVQIENSRSASGGGTSVKTGWYLNKRTFFAIVNRIGDSRPETLFLLEYMLNQNLDLIITQGEDKNEAGVDLRWQFDY